eukprot:gene29795-7430_t
MYRLYCCCNTGSTQGPYQPGANRVRPRPLPQGPYQPGANRVRPGDHQLGTTIDGERMYPPSCIGYDSDPFPRGLTNRVPTGYDSDPFPRGPTNRVPTGYDPGITNWVQPPTVGTYDHQPGTII